MKYEVTIGIPVFQSEAFIRRSLESALAQTYDSVEILIVDDGSRDGTMDIVRDIKDTHLRGKDIRICRHQSNQGVAASRNDMIDAAGGEYLYFMDSDDEIVPETIELMMRQARQYDAEVVYGSYRKVELSGQKTVYSYPPCQLLEEDQLALFAFRKYAGLQVSVCNCLMKVSLLRACRLRFIDTDFWEDMVFTSMLVTYVSRAVLLPVVTYTYLCREGSLSHYQQRRHISKEEVMRNVKAVEKLKVFVREQYNKVYYPQFCCQVAMTDFYIASHVLKRRSEIVPKVSNREIRRWVHHPATLRQIFSFRTWFARNLFLYLLGKLPSLLCVAVVKGVGKLKKKV
jgi:glycosyltransferase involved in cell wall biosynthesis